MNVLVVKANNRPDGVSTKMYETFMESVQGKENLNVNTFDVFEEDMPYFGQDLFNAIGKIQNDGELSDVEQRIVNAKQKAKDALAAADVLVFAFPLWNLTIPAKLQTFIDYIAEAGFTFKYDQYGNLEQLMSEKKVILLNARGGVYSLPEAAPMDMSVTYMRNLFGGLYGMDILNEIIIEGHNAMPEKSEEIIQDGLDEVKAAAENLSYQNA
ncbi:FMN-dependent NADH-azoreductase [Sinobaca qinghaiensis]|uniref:FMN dependent NADH:quinone oxidoreductase n=1 Tax=Sinobaca qinghaiensis TaxID=342944 RepID=A0A419V413_9BACL|nr:FMN-dependent NADH-azoreductase [Sinobaca qinghaiensis]RKD73126.1 FMN-dependent NADH-azoreductase [Sinobaca qinghaiensis]